MEIEIPNGGLLGGLNVNLSRRGSQVGSHTSSFGITGELVPSAGSRGLPDSLSPELWGRGRSPVATLSRGFRCTPQPRAPGLEDLVHCLAFSNWQLSLFNKNSELMWRLLCSCKCAIYGYCYYIPILQMKKLRHKDVK